MTILATRSMLQRVCRSTLTAETSQMELGVEAADQLRAAIADMFELLSIKQWEIEATSAIQLVWVTDCDSSRSAFVRPTMGKPTDKRLGITIASLRQAIWRRRGEAIGAPMVTDTTSFSGLICFVSASADMQSVYTHLQTSVASLLLGRVSIHTHIWSLE